MKGWCVWRGGVCVKGWCVWTGGRVVCRDGVCVEGWYVWCGGVKGGVCAVWKGVVCGVVCMKGGVLGVCGI